MNINELVFERYDATQSKDDQISAMFYKNGDALYGKLFYCIDKIGNEISAVLFNLQVLTPYRNKGIATNLVNKFLLECTKHNVQIIKLQASSGDQFRTNKELVKWYERFGFKIDDSNFENRINNESGISMHSTNWKIIEK